jgi:hypothetical protein
MRVAGAALRRDRTVSHGSALAVRLLWSLREHRTARTKGDHMRTLRFVTSVAALMTAVTLASARRADASDDPPPDAPAAGFGQRGRVVIAVSGATLLRQQLPPDPALGEITQTSFSVDAALSVFVAPRWSVGAAVTDSMTRLDANGGHSSMQQYQLSLRAGRLLPAGPWASVWPQLGLGVVHTLNGGVIGSSGGGPILGFASPAATLTVAELAVPLVLHPGRCFFVALGPVFQARVGSGTQVVSVNGRITFGASFGG